MLAKKVGLSSLIGIIIGLLLFFSANDILSIIGFCIAIISATVSISVGLSFGVFKITKKDIKFLPYLLFGIIDILIALVFGIEAARYTGFLSGLKLFLYLITVLPICSILLILDILLWLFKTNRKKARILLMLIDILAIIISSIFVVKGLINGYFDIFLLLLVAFIIAFPFIKKIKVAK